MKNKILYLTVYVTALIIAVGFSIAAFAQSAPKHYLSTASTNCNLVQVGKVILRNIVPVNTTAVIYYLKIFDKATLPVAGTDTPVLTFPVPVAAAAATIPITSVDGFAFLNGMGFCLVGAIADNDSSNAAVGVAINFGVSAN